MIAEPVQLPLTIDHSKMGNAVQDDGNPVPAVTVQEYVPPEQVTVVPLAAMSIIPVLSM
jgi:hypothetical protein